jgi:hypothetical protein
VASCGFLQGFFAKWTFLLWCFCGEFVVECVVNVVEKQRVFTRRKIGQVFQVYFFLVEKTFAPRRFHREGGRGKLGSGALTIEPSRLA